MLRILELIEEGRIELLAKDVICQNPTVTPNEKRTAEISRIPDIRLMEVHEQLKAEEAAKGNKVIGECAGIRGSYLLVEESTVPYISEGKSPEKPAHGCPACSSHDWWQRRDGEWICWRCHPRPMPIVVGASSAGHADFK